MKGELEAEQNCNILTPTLMAITAFISRSPGLLNRGPGGPSLSGTCSSFQHLLSTWLNFLCTEVYNNLMPTLLPVSVTISHSIQPIHGQGYILISSTGCTCYLHKCISYFDSLAGVNMLHLFVCVLWHINLL